MALAITCLAGRTETWTPVGQAQWTEGALTGIYSNYNKTWNVNVERSDDRPKVFRLQPYSNHTMGSSWLYDNVYVYIHCDNANAVYIDYFKFKYTKNSWTSWYYHVFQRCPENGFDSRYYGKITDENTIEFPIGAFSVTDNTSSSTLNQPASDARLSTYVHKIIFPDGVLDYTPEPENWVNIGHGEWEDPIAVTSDGDPLIAGVDVEKSTDNPSIYRIINPSGQTYININAEDPAKVYVSPYEATSGDDVWTITQNCTENGQNGSQYGTLDNGKIVIPAEYFTATSTLNPGSAVTGSAGRNCVLTLPDGFDNPLPEDYGVFMGIVAFNNRVTTKPISQLDQISKDDFTSFVDDLQMGNATLLYYAVDQSINMLESQTFPSNLSNAVLVTFTDGLDQGSLAMKPEHRTSKGYASYLAERIPQTAIQGIPLTAYAIGLKSNDVVDDELFMYNLASLSSKSDDEDNPDNPYISTVEDIDGLQKQLTDLYDSLNKQISKRVVTISVPMMSHGDLYRYTLDGAADDVTKSQIWFEGTFNIDNKSLENVTYHGFTSATGSTIATVQDDINVKIILNDCRNLEGGLLQVNNTEFDQWIYIPSHDKWGHNDENAKGGDVTVEDIKSSMAILFALDCSTSLGDLFPLVQETAKSFILRLAGAEVSDSGFDYIWDEKTGSFDINDPDVEIYNLMGAKVTNPSSGIYIYRKGNLMKKVMVP